MKFQSNFVDFMDSFKIIYRRYAGLYFCFCIDSNEGELATLEAIHLFVEVFLLTKSKGPGRLLQECL